MKFIFYYRKDISEYVFEDGTHMDDVSREFDSWMLHIFGIEIDESESIIESGEAGYYEI